MIFHHRKKTNDIGSGSTRSHISRTSASNSLNLSDLLRMNSLHISPTTMTISAVAYLLLLTIFSSATTFSSAHNITAILSSIPDYTEYANLLAKTKVADEINNRQTITVLVLNNSVVDSSLKSNQYPLETLKTLLSIHVLLDYFDDAKLHNIPDGSVISTNLYQTSGNALQRNGFVNVTDSKGKVFFASATEGSKSSSVYTKPIKALPYNISVVEISAPIDAPGVLTPTTPTKELNLTAALINAGCKTFANLITKQNVLQDYDGMRSKGLSVFAPSEDAWKKKKGLPDLTKLSDNDLKTVLRYHAAPNYFPMATLKGMKDAFITLATVGGDKYAIVPEASGDFVLLNTGVDSARVVNTIVDSAPVTIFLIDNVLLPVELFGKNSSTSPPSASPTPKPQPGSPPKAQPGSPPKPQPKTPTPASAPGLTPAPSKGPSPPTPSGEGPAAATTPTLAPEPEAADQADGTTPKKSGANGGGLLVSNMFKAWAISAILLQFVLH